MATLFWKTIVPVVPGGFWAMEWSQEFVRFCGRQKLLVHCKSKKPLAWQRNRGYHLYKALTTVSHLSCKKGK